MKNKGASTKINGLVRNGLFRILFIALLFVIAMACTPIVRAAGVVSSCDETSLLSAISGGGTVTFTCSGTITLTATITFSSNTTVDGAGQNVILSAVFPPTPLSEPDFFVSAGVSLELKNVTIHGFNGAIYNNSGIGTITNYGTLTVTSCTFDHNSEITGGAIANYGTLIVTNSTFANNHAFLGAGIYNAAQATLAVTRSNFYSNGDSSTHGGGIYNSSQSTSTVSNSTFDFNYSSNGGGIFNAGGTLNVANSTYFENVAYFGGSGIANLGTGTMTVTNSTFDLNFGSSINSGSMTLTLRNTIVANTLGGFNCPGSFSIDGGGNLDTDGTCVGTISPDPLLGPLQNNGGPTPTMAISMASPAFGGANPANCPLTDQRGVLRPQFQACDIGAFEFDTANSLLTAVRNNILTLIPTGNQHDQTTLTAVASALAAALNSHNWRGTDGNHLNPSEGEDVFELLVEKVSAPLTQLLKASPSSAIPAQTLQTLLNNVTLSGRMLATVAISDAAGGDPTKLAQANALVAKGDADAAAGKYISALVNYEIAWSLLHPD
jgi:hypothetical protein